MFGSGTVIVVGESSTLGSRIVYLPSVLFALASADLTKAGFRHAFFTREGGVSPPPWDSLNFAASVGDDLSHVRENLARAAAHLGVDFARLYMTTQVHGVAAVEVRGDEDRVDVARREADTLVTRAAGVACGVRSADCVPILVGDRSSGAACGIHSGWRGTASNAAEHGIRALRAAIGGDGDLVAAIGPHIEACCFEVGEDVAATLAGASPASDVIDRSGPRPRVNLRRIVRAQLEAAGLRPAAIDDVRGCTVCDARRFFSHRRDAARSGRLLSAIVARA